MLEIAKMLTLSTAHITPETAKRLDKFVERGERSDDLDGIVAYGKADYGWFIFVGDAKTRGLPADLKYLVNVAYNNDCLWLCLDRDGDTVDDLISYDW